MGAADNLFKSMFPDAATFSMMLDMADDDTALEMARAFLSATYADEETLHNGLCPWCFLYSSCPECRRRWPLGQFCPYYTSIKERLSVSASSALVWVSRGVTALISQQALIELGRTLFQEPLRDEYASAVSDPDVLRAWTFEAAEEIRGGIAGYPYKWRQLSGRKLEFIAGLARNEHTPPDALEALFKSLGKIPFKFTGHILFRMAENPSTPAHILEQMAFLNYPVGVRAAVAGNPNITPTAIRRLLQSPSLHIRAALAANPVAPRETLWHLVQSRQADVVGAVAGNPSAPPDLLAAIFEGKPPVGYAPAKVRRRALENPSFPMEKLDEALRRHLVDRPTAEAVLTSTRTPVEKLVEFAEAALAPSPRPGLLLYAADAKMVKALLSNPNFPEEHIYSFVFHTSEEVRKAALEELKQRGIGVAKGR